MCDYAIQRRNRSPKTNITPDNKLEHPIHPFSLNLSIFSPRSKEGLAIWHQKPLFRPNHQHSLPHDQDDRERPRRVPQAHLHRRRDDAAVHGDEGQRARKSHRHPQLHLQLVPHMANTGSWFNGSARPYRSTRQPVQGPAKPIFGVVEMPEPDFVVWGVFILAAAKESYGLPTAVQDSTLKRLLEKIPTVRRNDKSLGAVQKFFFREELVQSAGI